MEVVEGLARPPLRVAVVGAGVSGLACARVLSELSRRNGIPLSLMVLESSQAAGGVVHTVFRDGFLLEKGPESFLSENPRTFELCRELGIESELIETSPGHRRTLIVRRKRLVPLPEGFYLIAPKNIPAFLATPLFSPLGKLRMLAEPLVPKKQSQVDESVAAFIRRRFGTEALERVGQPMIAGVYSGDPEKLSMQSTMPRFCRAESEHGSVVFGIRAPRQVSGPRYSLFMSFRRGMSTLTDALERSFPLGCVQKNEKAAFLRRSPEKGVWSLGLKSGRVVLADAVCLAVPARVSARLLAESSPELSSLLSGIRYESVATLNLAFEERDIGHPLDAFGFVVPRTEGLSLMACTFSHRKFEGRAPSGKILLRAFVGGAFGREILERSDEAVTRAVLDDLNVLLGLRARPLFSELCRYPQALPQYEVGHTRLLEDLKTEASALGGLYLTGSSYQGTGIPDCVKEAEECARRLWEKLAVANVSAKL